MGRREVLGRAAGSPGAPHEPGPKRDFGHWSRRAPRCSPGLQAPSSSLRARPLCPLVSGPVGVPVGRAPPALGSGGGGGTAHQAHSEASEGGKR